VTPESIILNNIIRAYGTRSDLRIWRANAGAAVLHGRRVSFGIPGQADLTGIIPVTQNLICPNCQQELATPPLGVRLEIETKTPTGKQRPDQVNFEAMIRRFHGCYILARSVDDVAAALSPLGL
jgi:hypothetical protein